MSLDSASYSLISTPQIILNDEDKECYEEDHEPCVFGCCCSSTNLCFILIVFGISIGFGLVTFAVRSLVVWYGFWGGFCASAGVLGLVLILAGVQNLYKQCLLVQKQNSIKEYRVIEGELQETKIDFAKIKQDKEQLQLRWLVNYDDIIFEKVIGAGAFGKVWRGRWQNKIIAVKKMFPEPDTMMMPNDSHSTISINNTTTQNITQIALDMLNNIEVGVMMSLRHEHIVDFEGAGQIIEKPREWETEPQIGIFVMLEYAAGGDLTHRLQDAAGSLLKFSWKDRVQCASDIASGMSFLHSQGFIHRDLKSMNVLCDEHGKCMIADLGLARRLERAADADSTSKNKNKNQLSLQNACLNERKVEGMTAWQGTAAWMAPEVTSYDYSLSVDVFSFGVILWELLTCRMPWAGSAYTFPHLIIGAVLRGERPEVTNDDLKDVPDGYVALMKQCWQTEPKERPTFKHAMSMLSSLLYRFTLPTLPKNM
jgi:serine/threonine protein kinase